MPLFQISSRLDGKTYEVDWDTDKAVLRVNQPSASSPVPTGWAPAPPTPPPGFAIFPGLDTDNVRAFEEGRLSRSGEGNPYESTKGRFNQSTAWAFGVLCK